MFDYFEINQQIFWFLFWFNTLPQLQNLKRILYRFLGNSLISFRFITDPYKMSKENKCTQVPYRISIHEKYMSVDKLKSYVSMIDNVRIKKFLFDQTFDIVNVITPNKISFKELQKILLKSMWKEINFFLNKYHQRILL